MAEIVEEFDAESLEHLLGGHWPLYEPLVEETLQDWSPPSVVNASHCAARVPPRDWNNVSNSDDDDDDDDDEDGGGLNSPPAEEPRLWLSGQSNLNPVAVNVALDTSEALAFTFCESLMVESPSIYPEACPCPLFVHESFDLPLRY